MKSVLRVTGLSQNLDRLKTKEETPLVERDLYFISFSFHFQIRRVALQPELIYKGASTKKHYNLQKPYTLKQHNIQT